jgi:haloalkane dehalogenase
MTMTYEIRVQGHLSPDWSEWLEGLRIIHTPNGQTVLMGSIRDQAALFGTLMKIRDLGLTLIAVNQVQSGPE